MKESLESARNIHQFLIVASVAIFIFGLSIGPNENKYDLAKAELIQFRKSVDDIGTIRRHLIRKAFFSRVSPKDLKQVTRFVGFSDMSNLGAWDSPIHSIYQDFENEWHLIDSLPVNILTKDAVDLLKDTTVMENKEHFALNAFPVYLKGQIISEGTAYIEIETDLKYMNGEVVSYLKEFIKNKLAASSDVKTFLPKFKVVRSEISDHSIDDALTQLQNLSDDYNSKNKNEADFIGLKVTGGLLYIVGPLVVLSLLVYLLSLATHLDEISIPAQTTCLLEFPWIALFRDKYSIWICRVSLYALPFLSCSYLVYKTNVGISQMVIIYVLTILPSLYIAHCLSVKIIRLRSKTVNGSLIDQ